MTAASSIREGEVKPLKSAKCTDYRQHDMGICNAATETDGRQGDCTGLLQTHGEGGWRMAGEQSPGGLHLFMELARAKQNCLSNYNRQNLANTA